MSPSLGALCCLQAWEQHTQIPGGVAWDRLLRRLVLDASPASLARIDTFLDALRTAKKPQPQAFLADPASRNLLDLLAFYAGDVVGRALRCAPEWLLREDVGFDESMVCHYPGADAASGVFAPLVAICARLFAGQRDTGVARSAAAWMPPTLAGSVAPLPPAPGFGYPIELRQALAQCGPRALASLALRPPAGPEKLPLSRFFAAAPQVLRSGRIAWAGAIRPDPALGTPQPQGGATGELVYDPAGRAPAAVLDEVADVLSELKARPIDEPALPAFSAWLAGGPLPGAGLDVPAAISPYPLKIAATWFDRGYLPGHVLAHRSFPVVLSTQHPGIVLPLPAPLWPAPLLQAWQP